MRASALRGNWQQERRLLVAAYDRRLGEVSVSTPSPEPKTTTCATTTHGHGDWPVNAQ